MDTKVKLCHKTPQGPFKQECCLHMDGLMDLNKATDLMVDGSGESLGYTISQPRKDGGRNIIKCNSNGLTAAQ